MIVLKPCHRCGMEFKSIRMRKYHFKKCKARLGRPAANKKICNICRRYLSASNLSRHLVICSKGKGRKTWKSPP